MFNTEKNDKTDIALPASPKIDNTLANAKYKSIIPQTSSFNDLTYNAIDEILENEKVVSPYPKRWLAIKLLEKDEIFQHFFCPQI
jgi:hypothetical protein